MGTTQKYFFCQGTSGIDARSSGWKAWTPTIPCALVPWNAKELTPQPSRDCVSDIARGATLRASMNLLACPAMMPSRCGFTCVRCSSGCAVADDMAVIACTIPDIPAAGSVCPMHVFPALSTSVLSWVPSTALVAPTSIGSPRAVPVPCICRL